MRRARGLVGVGLAAGLVVGFALPAAAHVTLHSTDAVQGGSDALLVVRVPNEEDNATTSQVEVDFPISAPMLNTLVEPTPGWTFHVTQTTLPTPITTDDGTFTQVVTKVVWSGGTIPVGGYQDFHLDVSTLPKVPTLDVKALQTYSNGDIVRWIDPAPAPGQPAPDHPTPTLSLAPAAAAETSSGASTATTAPASPTTAAGATTAAAPTVSLVKTSDVNGAKTLSIVALVIGILGVVVAGAAMLLFRRRAA
jgi:periplasmic copper chaperone A